MGVEAKSFSKCLHFLIVLERRSLRSPHLHIVVYFRKWA